MNVKTYNTSNLVSHLKSKHAVEHMVYEKKRAEEKDVVGRSRQQIQLDQLQPDNFISFGSAVSAKVLDYRISYWYRLLSVTVYRIIRISVKIHIGATLLISRYKRLTLT